VDALLAAARPSGAHEVWHRGDALDEGQRARTSGIQIEVIDSHDAADVVDAIDAFLDAEAAFLGAVTRASIDDAQSVLACALWVYGDEPVPVQLPVETLGRLAKAGVSLEVSGFPRTDD
jgi:hypothetical protein